tara:strand:+ start:881 stop:1204 length:324 start_codon:yes stop_codon:yes gene_type:complete
MATKQIASNAVNTIINTPETIFTAGINSVIIEAFTAANNSGINASYKAYIVEQDGTQQPQIPFNIVVWGRSDLGIGIVNQIIPAGGSLKVECSALASIYFTVTGREI